MMLKKIFMMYLMLAGAVVLIVLVAAPFAMAIVMDKLMPQLCFQYYRQPAPNAQ